MKIGYACINQSLPCRRKTFRLASYSEARLREAVENNLDCLAQTLRFNVEHRLLLFRITSNLVPFASHPVCRFGWRDFFGPRFREIGRFVQEHRLRVSMHPDQFTLINAFDENIVFRSTGELAYHAAVLDAMEVDATHKIQIHVGGVYGNRALSRDRFIRNYRALPPEIRKALVIENDDRLFTLADCLRIHGETGIPVVFDVFHHGILNEGEPVEQALPAAIRTWSDKDGAAIVDYSSQESGKRPGAHASTIDAADFRRFLKRTAAFDFDVMLEIKDKEASALKARGEVWRVRGA